MESRELEKEAQSRTEGSETGVNSESPRGLHPNGHSIILTGRADMIRCEFQEDHSDSSICDPMATPCPLVDTVSRESTALGRGCLSLRA